MDEQHKKQVYQLTDIGHWELDVVNEELYWSDELKRLHEVDLDYEPNLEAALAFYEEGEHRANIREGVNRAIKEGESFTIEAKIITAKGNPRWIKAIGEPKMENGRCVRVFGSTQDITEQRRAKQQAKKAQQELHELVEHSTIMFYRHGTDHKLTYVSPQSEQFLGCSPEKAKKHWTEFITNHPKNEEGLETVEKAIETGEAQPPYELQLKRTDGKVIWVQVNESPIVEDGETVEIVGSLTDITSLKEKQQKLKEKETQLRNIANNIDGMIHRYIRYPDGSDEFTFVSEGVNELHEVTPQQVLESSDLLWSQIVDEHLDQVKRSVRNSAEQLTPWNQKWKIETPSGQQKWIHGRGTPKQLDDGSVQWDTILLDVTDQKELEHSVNRQVNLLNNILDSIPGLFYMVAEDMTFARANKNVETLFGLNSDQLAKTNALTLVAPRERSKAKRRIGEAFREGYADLETVLLGGDGKEHHYFMNGSRIELDGNYYVIGSGIDITQRIQTEEENTILLQEVHHRVKNNLAIISGILTLELEELSSESFNRLPLERSVNRIHSIAKVHELLYQTSSFSQVNIREYISNLANTVTDTLQLEKNIDIRLNVEDIEMNINEIIPLGMLLNELLTNSLKYAFQDKKEGVITLEITPIPDAYKVHYQDNGRGFNLAEFEQSKSLGLTIVNMLLKQLQADYEVNTENGFNISFTFDKKVTGAHSNM